MTTSGKLASALLLSIGLLASGGAGCGSPDPSVSGTSPLRAYRGRTTDVLLSGSGTSWDANATVDFGAGVTVNKVTAASPTALLANITVAADAAIGPRDITVTQGGDRSPYTMAFMIESPIDVRVEGTTAQGSIVFLTIENKDLEHLFDDTSTGDGFFSPIEYTNIEIAAPTGTTLSVSSVTPFRISATMLIDLDAPPGGFDLDIQSGPSGGERDSFPYPDLLTIESRTAEALAGTATFNLDTPYASRVYKITAGGAGNFIKMAVSGDAAEASPQIVLLGASGAFADLIDNGPEINYTASGTEELVLVIFDGGGTGGYAATVDVTDTALVPHAGGEGNDVTNDSPGMAVALTAPTIVEDADLTSVTDVDWYKVTLAAGDVGKRLFVQTLAGDAGTDLTIRLYKGNDESMPLGEEVDSSSHESTTSPTLGEAGDYLIRIAASPMYFQASASRYDLVVILQ